MVHHLKQSWQKHWFPPSSSTAPLHWWGWWRRVCHDTTRWARHLSDGDTGNSKTTLATLLCLYWFSSSVIVCSACLRRQTSSRNYTEKKTIFTINDGILFVVTTLRHCCEGGLFLSWVRRPEAERVVMTHSVHVSTSVHTHTHTHLYMMVFTSHMPHLVRLSPWAEITTSLSASCFLQHFIRRSSLLAW